MAKITVLGSGVMDITKERNPSGFLVETRNNTVLLDCGFGILRRLVDYGRDLQKIDLVCISHFHTDHFSDCFPLVHSRFVHDAYIDAEHKPLAVIGPDGISSRYKKWREIFWPEPAEDYPVEIKENGARELGEIKVDTFDVQHVRWFKSLGYILKVDGKKVIYTGDIGSCHDFKDLAKVCEGADLLITEASFDVETPNHFSSGQIKKLVDEAGVKKCLIAHVRPNWIGKSKELVASDDRIQIADDGLEINL